MPSITFWTRIEPSSRGEDIDAGLQARTNDPLWLLARQWQTGEFQGEDAGTPVLARLQLERSPLARFRPGAAGPSRPYRSDVPLETLVEREPVQRADDPRRDVRVAAEAGLYVLRLLARFKVSPEGREAFIAAPKLALPKPSSVRDDDAGRRYLTVMHGRVPDGFLVHGRLAPTRLRPRRPGSPSASSTPSPSPRARATARSRSRPPSTPAARATGTRSTSRRA